MPEMLLQSAAIRVESVLARPVPFPQSNPSQAAERALSSFSKYGLTPSHFYNKPGDELFSYEFGFSLFRGNGSVTRTSEKLTIRLENASTEEDLKLLETCTLQAHECFDDLLEQSTFTASVHTQPKDPAELQDYLGRFEAPSQQIIAGGRIAVVQLSDWPSIIHLTVEASAHVRPGLFLQWITKLNKKRLEATDLSKLRGALIESASRVDVTFADQP